MCVSTACSFYRILVYRKIWCIATRKFARSSSYWIKYREWGQFVVSDIKGKVLRWQFSHTLPLPAFVGRCSHYSYLPQSVTVWPSIVSIWMHPCMLRLCFRSIFSTTNIPNNTRVLNEVCSAQILPLLKSLFGGASQLD